MFDVGENMNVKEDMDKDVDEDVDKDAGQTRMWTICEAQAPPPFPSSHLSKPPQPPRPRYVSPCPPRRRHQSPPRRNCCPLLTLHDVLDGVDRDWLDVGFGRP